MRLLTEKIKDHAVQLGFDACGCSRAETVDNEVSLRFGNWLQKSYHAYMGYMENHREKRLSPELLVENAKTIISVALNYYPDNKQPEEAPQIAYYAYGKDYHDVMKAKLNALLEYIQSLDSSIEGRAFCDTAPILERYWAARSGIGFIGKNSMLIIPGKGSYFFLGELVINKELEYDIPLSTSCGKCTRCMDACPARAIVAPRVIDSNRCISYQTIENKGAIDEEIMACLGNCFYGCDICQQACPWNRFSKPNQTKEFNPSDVLLAMTYDSLIHMTEEEYRTVFKGSAIKRAKYTGLKRNIAALTKKK